MSDNAEYIFSDVLVTDTKITRNEIPMDNLLKLAGTIWNEVLLELTKLDKSLNSSSSSSSKSQSNEDKLETIFSDIYNKYHDFGSSFPLILRWMVQMKKYSERAFKKFLIKYKSANITSKKEFLILQAEYIVYVYEDSGHHDKKNINTYREFIVKQLLEEEETFNQIQNELKQELEHATVDQRKELYNYIKKNYQ